jgi:hypothetical protein
VINGEGWEVKKKAWVRGRRKEYLLPDFRFHKVKMNNEVVLVQVWFKYNKGVGPTYLCSKFRVVFSHKFLH